MTMQVKHDLVHPRTLEHKITGAAYTLAWPGSRTDIATWRAALTGYCRQAENVAAHLRQKAYTAHSDTLRNAWQLRLWEYEDMAAYGRSVLG